MDAERLRLERIADTEGMGRLTNEHIVASADTDRTAPLRCECGDDVCHERLMVERGVYERIRQDSMLFIIRPGHEIPDAEDVVEAADGYEVVRKREDMRAVVERSDPRRATTAD
jgi:hypothetical protein